MKDKDNYDQIVQAYIERVTALRDQRQALPDAAMLQGIAQELGMTQADLMAAEAAAIASEQRGIGYIRHQRWDDAIAELTNVVALKPTDVKVLYQLAVAYKSRWLVDGNSQDQQAAIRLAKQCVELSPNFEPAFALLNELDRSRSTRSASRRAPQIGKLLAIGAGVGVVALIMLGGLVYVSFRPSGPSRLPVSQSPIVSQSSSGQPSDVEVPVRFIPTDKVKELQLAVRKSSYATYGSSFYTLSADLKNQSQSEIHELKLKLEFLNPTGQVFRTDFLSAVSSTDAPLRPGDELGLRWLEENSTNTQAVQVSVQTVSLEPGAKSYAPSPPIAIQWLSQRSPEMNVTIRERNSRFNTYSSGEAYHTLTLEVQNTGKVSLKELKLLIETLDQGNQVLSSNELYIVSSSDPSLLPGQTRVKRTTASTPAFRRYRVSIVNAE